MTTLARTTASLSLEGRAALHTYVEVALEQQTCPWFDDLCREGVLLGALLVVDGTWQDVLDLIALHEDHLTEFLNPFHARTRWASLGGRVTDSPAALEAAAA